MLGQADAARGVLEGNSSGIRLSLNNKFVLLGTSSLSYSEDISSFKTKELVDDGVL